jgi:pimeloyl-ACP methyl ester carboxylesterase
MSAREFFTPLGRRKDLALYSGEGRGPALVVVHGLEDTWDCWYDLATKLAGRCRLYVLDMPWRAGNSYLWSLRGTPGDWLRRGLEMVPEPVVALVGHSFGSNAILQYLADCDAPGVDAAVLLAPFYRPKSLKADWDLHNRARAGLRRIMSEGLRLKLGARAAKLDPDVFESMVDTVLDRIGPVGFGTFFNQFAGTTELELGTVRTPTLVLAGETDESLAGPRAVALAEAMPAASVFHRADYGHFCHIAQAGLVAAELADFLADHLTPEPVSV